MTHGLVGLDHVQLAAPRGCEAEARRFFGEILGLEEIEKPPTLRGRGGVWFRCGAQQLHIGVASDFAPAKKAHPAFLVADLDALRLR
ncbi:MAG TPA: glyoxalase, partial [Limnochordia bacterium]|nr:glyoxalase [Limnochordia bacterium]